MSKDYKKVVSDISAYLGELNKASPDVMAGFGAMSKGAMQNGILDEKTKELIALAIGVSQKCDGCIGFHIKALHKLGATRQELVEVLNVAIYMGGGPVLMYAADALRAYDQFAE
jgi:AhpD family alkylhydroperoxidase